jgi:hypothetical protein
MDIWLPSFSELIFLKNLKMVFKSFQKIEIKILDAEIIRSTSVKNSRSDSLYLRLSKKMCECDECTFSKFKILSNLSFFCSLEYT